MTDDGAACRSCNGSIATGERCDILIGDVDFCVPEQQTSGLCYECVEGRFTEMDSCTPCGDGSRRCVNGSVALLCDDALTINAGECVEVDENALAATNNHVVKCAEGLFADGVSCGECPPMCVSCANITVCDICAESTLGDDLTCLKSGAADVQTTNGTISCKDGFFLDEDFCAKCSDVFGGECVSCSHDECLLCKSGSVLLGGVCTAPTGCAVTDGAVCTGCPDGSVRLNATECVARGECVEYHDGVCAQCIDTMVNDGGTCVAPDGCSTLGNGVCLRCNDGMFPDESGVCRRLSARNLTRSMRRVVYDVRVQHVVLSLVQPPSRYVFDRQRVPQQRDAGREVQRLCDGRWLPHLQKRVLPP